MIERPIWWVSNLEGLVTLSQVMTNFTPWWQLMTMARFVPTKKARSYKSLFYINLRIIVTSSVQCLKGMIWQFVRPNSRVSSLQEHTGHVGLKRSLEFVQLAQKTNLSMFKFLRRTKIHANLPPAVFSQIGPDYWVRFAFAEWWCCSSFNSVATDEAIHQDSGL